MDLSKIKQENENYKNTMSNLNSELKTEKLNNSHLVENKKELNNKMDHQSKNESKYENINKINKYK